MFEWLTRRLGISGKGTHASTLREQGNELLAQDRHAEAGRCYEKALSADPRDAKALISLGFVQSELGRPVEAVASLQKAVALVPDDFDACYLLAIASEQCADLDKAIAWFQRALEIQPASELAHRDLGRVLSRSGKFVEAREILEQGISLHPDSADLQFYLGNLLLEEHRPALAIISFRKALSMGSTDANVHASLGAAHDRLGQLEQAATSYQNAIRLAPRNALFQGFLATLLLKQGHTDAAIAGYQKAIALDPEHAGIHGELGEAFRQMGDFAAAAAHCRKAVALQPDLASAHNCLGAVLGESRQFADALSSFGKAIALAPDFAEALGNRSNTLLSLNRREEALADAEKAVSLRPVDSRLLNQLGVVLHRLGQRVQALEKYDAALAATATHVEALNNRGNVLADMGRLADADASYARALSISGDYAPAHFNRGNVQRRSGRMEDALASYVRALALQPDLPFLFGNWLHLRMQACDWTDLGRDFEELEHRIDDTDQVFNPFTLVSTHLTPAQHRRAVEAYARDQFPVTARPVWSPPPVTNQRIRLGYFSADFHEHATAYLMAELFERHNKEKFELFAFSFGPETPNAMRTRLENAFDQFLVVNSKSDPEIAAMARGLRIDIAVDLKGYTQNCRPGIFACGAAPLQVNYLGYPGTLGTPCIDYIIADQVLIPKDHQDFYSEKVVYLPDSYQANDSLRQISTRSFTREELGLPHEGFVFCCFNSSFKITPAIFDVWMRLLQEVPGSVLWLLDDNPLATRHLRDHARDRGVAAERLVFSPRMPLSEHLARHRLADLFLDTCHCNAHTTASDALWAGLPVLTCLGETFAGRVASSLLTAVGLQELITKSLEEYEAKALELARDEAGLAELKADLAARRTQAPLFDAQLFARHIESAFDQMHALHRAGQPPRHIVVTR